MLIEQIKMVKEQASVYAKEYMTLSKEINTSLQHDEDFVVQQCEVLEKHGRNGSIRSMFQVVKAFTRRFCLCLDDTGDKQRKMLTDKYGNKQMKEYCTRNHKTKLTQNKYNKKNHY